MADEFVSPEAKEVHMYAKALKTGFQLVKMAIIHHQFESIHPFYDGNGRTGRIINILYLIQKKLLNIRALVKNELLEKQKIGRDNFYINRPLFDLLASNK